MVDLRLIDLKGVYKNRPEWSRKGDFGKVLVIGGSKKYTGAPALVALAAYASGADLVAVAAPRRAADIVASFAPEIITYPLEGDYLEGKHIREIGISRFDSVVFGNGLGEKSESICKEIFKIKKPCVVDGDALKFVDKRLGKNFLLTPHAGEFAILTGKRVPADLEKGKKAVEKFAKEKRCTVLLKGHIDVISNGKETIENKTGSPYMTKAGTGDVLAGICGALLARCADTLKAGELGTYISGRAGELAAKEKGESLLATDVIKRISRVIPNYS